MYSLGIITLVAICPSCFLSFYGVVMATTPKIKPGKVTKIKKTDSRCFLEGLFFRSPDTLVESCGLEGRSQLREFRLDKNLGADSALYTHTTKLTKQVPVKKIFAEGVVDLKGKTYGLSYTAHKLFVYNRDTWQVEKTLKFPYGQV